jgi:cell division protein FtsB
MRIRRSVARFFGLAIVVAVSITVTSYFGYNAVWGERGYVALQDTNAKLATAKAQLDRVTDQNKRLEHRIALLTPGAADPDLVEELARTQLMDGAPGQVAVPRDKQ